MSRRFVVSLEPLAFLSHDRHENGRLSEFRSRLEGEVRSQTGRPFHIFQDRSDIGWGQQWKQRVEESLDAATFLIAIVTPEFFNSAACREEFELFLERERKLGRDNLILPVYYVDSPILGNKARYWADPVAREIAARRFADWRKLRFEPFTDPTAGKTLAQLAQQIVKALEPDRLPGKPVPLAADRSVRQISGRAESEPAGTVATEATPARKNEPPFRDQRLLPGENPDLKIEILNTLGEEWLYAKNLWLEGRAPDELIGTSEEFKVRDLLRSIRVAALS